MWSRRSLRLLWPSRSDRLLICWRGGGEGGRGGGGRERIIERGKNVWSNRSNGGTLFTSCMFLFRTSLPPTLTLPPTLPPLHLTSSGSTIRTSSNTGMVVRSPLSLDMWWQCVREEDNQHNMDKLRFTIAIFGYTLQFSVSISPISYDPHICFSSQRTFVLGPAPQCPTLTSVGPSRPVPWQAGGD